jgi:endonuclease/exonuclease/phosphatase (EEP) superfamily protein YafD
MKRHNAVLLFCLISLLLLSSVRYFESADNWLIDIFSHFAVQYAMLSLLLLAICIWKRIIPFAIFAAFLFAVNISVLANFGHSAQAAEHKYNYFKVYSANINKNNRAFSKLARGLEEMNADILVLQEVTWKHIELLQSLIQSYPYCVVNLNTGSSGRGIVLMSKFQILNHEVTKYSEFGNMTVSATLEIEDKQIAFYATHFTRPSYRQEFPARSIQYISLAKQINEQSGPVIVAGDFNATPYCSMFKKLLKMSGLRDSSEGFGWQPSWPTFFPLLWIPIDHILISPEIQVYKRATGSHIGSDHYPVFAEMSIN